MGEKITHLAAEYGAERTAVIHRLKRRFPEEYAKLSAAGLITCAPSEKALKARSAKLDEKWANDPAVLEYLHGNGNGNGRGCAEFCVNGLLAGDCRLVRSCNEQEETRRT